MMAAAPPKPTIAHFGYDPRSWRYRNLLTGRIVAAREVRAATDAVIGVETASMRTLSGELVEGRITIAAWQQQMQAMIKTLHVATALAGNGGRANTTKSDLGAIGALLKEQYTFLRAFAGQIESGAQPKDGTLLARAALYGEAARGTHEKMRERASVRAGASQQRSVIGAADHCGQCLSEAKKGWSPIGSLIPIGSRTCLANCHCTMEYKS